MLDRKDIDRKIERHRPVFVDFPALAQTCQKYWRGVSPNIGAGERVAITYESTGVSHFGARARAVPKELIHVYHRCKMSNHFITARNTSCEPFLPFTSPKLSQDGV